MHKVLPSNTIYWSLGLYYHFRVSTKSYGAAYKKMLGSTVGQERISDRGWWGCCLGQALAKHIFNFLRNLYWGLILSCFHLILFLLTIFFDWIHGLVIRLRQCITVSLLVVLVCHFVNYLNGEVQKWIR